MRPQAAGRGELPYMQPPDKVDVIQNEWRVSEDLSWQLPLRQLANGIKHCKPTAGAEIQFHELQWEHADFWESPGHVGNDWVDWFVDMNQSSGRSQF